MAVYFVTGKLGAGKTLTAVGMIRDRLSRDCRVATNLNIHLPTMVGRKNKTIRLERVPDKPSIVDLEGLGNANRTYDEAKNGLLVLDECGTWFNSRTWGDKERQQVINWFLHARKLGWDIIFIVQDISIVDKQARLALAEHVVYCRRLDRANIPIIGTIFKILTLGHRLPLPKVHIGIVKYGDGQNALTVDTWMMLGNRLYACYDTKQQFSDFYSDGLYSVLPPYYTVGRYQVLMTPRNIMRITKIYFRQYSRIFSFTFGALLMAVYSWLFIAKEPAAAIIAPATPQVTDIPLSKAFEGYSIVSYAKWPGKPSTFQLKNSDGVIISSESLERKGITVKSRGQCEALLVKGGDYVSIYCA